MSRRDLDAAIAEHVFGLHVEPHTNTRTREPDYVYEVHPGQWVQVAYYSSGSASLTLGLRLQDLGWKQSSAPRDNNVTLVHADGRTVSATGRSESEALARAGLKATV